MEKQKLENEDLVALVTDAIQNGGIFCFYPQGVSMLPTVRPGLDAVLLTEACVIQKYDLLLYRRQNGALVLHRLLRMTKTGLTFAGDNQGYAEKNVPRDAVIAKATAILRNGGSTNETRISLCEPAALREAKRQARRYPLRRIHLLLAKLKQKLLSPFRKS